MKFPLVIGFLLGFSLAIFIAGRIARAQEPRIEWASIELPKPKYLQPKPTDAILTVSDSGHEVVSIRHTGRIFVNGREIKTDREYRAAMMQIMKLMAGPGCKQ